MTVVPQARLTVKHPPYVTQTSLRMHPSSLVLDPFPSGLQGPGGGSLGSVMLHLPGEAARMAMPTMSGLPFAFFLLVISTSWLRQ